MFRKRRKEKAQDHSVFGRVAAMRAERGDGTVFGTLAALRESMGPAAQAGRTKARRCAPVAGRMASAAAAAGLAAATAYADTRPR